MSIIDNEDQVITLASHGRPMTASPARFDGTLDDLYDRYVAPNVLSTESVIQFHSVLANHAFSHDPLLLVRYVRDTERRRIYTTRDGTRFKATDNAPAWWIHAALFHEARFAPATFGRIVGAIPTHMFDVPPALAPSSVDL